MWPHAIRPCGRRRGRVGDNVKNRRYRYTRPGVELMTVLIVVGALSLWSMWPRPSVAPVPTAEVATTRVRYVGSVPAAGGDDALLFLRHRRADASVGMDAEVATSSAPLQPQPRFLAADLTPSTLAPEADRQPLREQARRRLSGYELSWPYLDPYRAGTGYVLRCEVEIDTVLQAAGFQVPPDALARLGADERPWQVVCEVTCAADGRVRDVFVIEAVRDGVAREDVVRVLMEATTDPGLPRSGRVTVRCGRAAVGEAG
jgi:hypothetical protein